MTISENLKSIRNELPSTVKLVAVSKFKPVSCILEAYSAGQRTFAESRPKEFMDKAMLCPSDIEWHFIGHLQTNKVKMVVPYVSIIESVDSMHLLEEIDRFSASIGKVTDVLLEVHVACEETKQGFSPDELNEVISASTRLPNIRLRGLMGMASHVEDESRIREDFNKIHSLFLSVKEAANAPDSYVTAQRLSSFDTLSMGMSADWKIAVEEGSNNVRIGTAIFGER